MKNTKRRISSNLSHPEKMLIYNEFTEHKGTYKEISKRLKVSVYTLKKVALEMNDLIRYKIYGEVPRYPKVCNLCGGKVKLNRCDKNKSRSGWVYFCTKCYAWVGTSIKEPKKALGELAYKDVRKKRRELHQWFDKLWSNRNEREYYYDRLAAELGKAECHFSQMSMEELELAEAIVKKWWLEKFDR